MVATVEHTCSNILFPNYSRKIELSIDHISSQYCRQSTHFYFQLFLSRIMNNICYLCCVVRCQFDKNTILLKTLAKTDAVVAYSCKCYLYVCRFYNSCRRVQTPFLSILPLVFLQFPGFHCCINTL